MAYTTPQLAQENGVAFLALNRPARRLMEKSPASVTATKRLLSSLAAEALERQIARAVEEKARVRVTADFREGVTVFLEKRKPQWSRR